MPHRPSSLTIASTLVLAATATVFGQTPAATPKADLAAARPYATKAPASPGLVNEWLRSQHDEFKRWDFGGQVRFRVEAFDGLSFATPARDFQRTGVDNVDRYFLVREKLHLGYQPAAWFSAYFEGRDSSSTGEDGATNPGADAADIHQAYFTLGNAKDFPLTLKAGRQEMIYGDERLIGASDWTNAGRVFDAIKLRLGDKDHGVDFFVSRPVLADNPALNLSDDYDNFSGVYFNSKSLLPFQTTELYFLSRNTEVGAGLRTGVGAAIAPRDIYSVGFRLKSTPGKFGNWDYTVEHVNQFGSINQANPGAAATRHAQQAFASSVNVGYTWAKTTAMPRFAVEYNFSTGDSNPDDGQSETLDNLFPTNHKHYGYMDYIGWRNLHNLRFQLSAKPRKDLALSLDYQLYRLADDRDLFYPQAGGGRNTAGLGYGRNSGFSKFVGSEINLDATWTPQPWLAVRGGYGHFFTGAYVDSSKAAVGGSRDGDWLYLQTTLSF